MADLGQIATASSAPSVHALYGVPYVLGVVSMGEIRRSGNSLISPGSIKRLSGTVTVNGAPTSRLVRLFNRATGALVGETVSGSDGSYHFDVAAGDLYTVMAMPLPDDQANAAILDHMQGSVVT